jgi:diketogulonate reductase-like aldo/keto reductase
MEKFFNEMCLTAFQNRDCDVPLLEQSGLDMSDDNSDPASGYSLGKFLTRRQVTRFLTGAGAALILPRRTTIAKNSDASRLSFITRAIPSSGEKLPVIGLGTWRVFDVGSSSADRAPLEEVLRAFGHSGARLIDSSPMYGRAEEVIGDIAAKLGIQSSLFLATKVWTTGQREGIKSMERSFQRFQTKRIDLMQVHNLIDAKTHLATLREWKHAGRFGYIGVTHYEAGALPAIEKILKEEKFDFLQINYSLMEREAEDRILPLARDGGVAVIANRPFGGGDLFERARAEKLPDWAAEFDCKSWAQFFLKWIIANPAITCAIPATGNVKHLNDNLLGGVGRLPDAKMRQRMIEFVTRM